ncbi:MAG: hypothetical protein JEY97_12520 [Bacteroidales bacterium]|nr:hypothetical protein [Bacteroidales bacterium]
MLNATNVRASISACLVNDTTNSEFIKADTNWILIIEANVWIMTKFIEANVDPKTVNFQDTTAFLSMLNLTETEYNLKHAEVKAAAIRLIQRYNINDLEDCLPCDQTETEVIASEKKSLTIIETTLVLTTNFLP